jgi:hypothetical protein
MACSQGGQLLGRVARRLSQGLQGAAASTSLVFRTAHADSQRSCQYKVCEIGLSLNYVSIALNYFKNALDKRLYLTGIWLAMRDQTRRSEANELQSFGDSRFREPFERWRRKRHDASTDKG